MKSITLGKKKKMTIDLSDFEEIGVYTESEDAKCEYCQYTMPIKFGPNTIVRSYDYKGRIIWRCNDCHRDMLNKEQQ